MGAGPIGRLAARSVRRPRGRPHAARRVDRPSSPPWWRTSPWRRRRRDHRPRHTRHRRARSRTVPASAPHQAPDTVRRAAREDPPAGQTNRSTTTAPMRTSAPAKATNWASQWTAPSMGSGLAAAAAGGGAAGTPIPKVKLPDTGWPSSEMTCQTTRYDASGRPGRRPIAAAASSPPGWVAGPASTRLDRLSTTMIARAGRDTASLNVRTTESGSEVSWAPWVGDVDSRSA